MSGYESDERHDEISEIKSAMRLCRTRQRAFQSALDRKAETRDELDEEQTSSQSRSLCLLKKQHCESIIKLEKRCMALEEELNYTKKLLKSKERNLQEESALVELKVKAIDAEYKQSFGEMKKALNKNENTVKSEVSKLFYLLSMLERNTLHGRHLAKSETNVGLLLKLRSSLDVISTACRNPSSLPSSDQVDELSEEQEVTPSPHVDSTLLDICKHLEDENNALKEQVTKATLELKDYKHRASKTSLIPHYRAVIVKTREDCDILKSDAARHIEKIKALEVKLQERNMDVQKLEANKMKMAAYQFQLKEERDKYKGVIYDVIEDKQPGLYKEGSNDLLKKADGGKLNFSKICTEPHFKSFANGSESKWWSREADVEDGRESLIKKNLDDLDCEIGSLRHRLELATVARTQNIMSDVIGQSVS
mmetsp:Transcript_985/g.2125  ORF Transcript_985/g.2125 Transcript_985/m.2125 type:complete len:423 (+) Transcript_985:61-1329(+)